MKKLGIFLFGALFLSAAIIPTRLDVATAEDKTPGEQLQDLVNEYLAGEGKYTKKTTIGLNDTSVAEMASCFHNNLRAKKRTTYYAPNKLLLANEDGSISAGSGSYYYDADEEQVMRKSALADSTEENMWENLSAGQKVYDDKQTCLEDKYVTLNTFAENNYFASWGYDYANQTYYYDLTNEEKEKTEEYVYKCDMWNEFLGFCAPMLYDRSGEYISAKSLTIRQKYDANANKYLELSMYLEDIDSGKLEESFLARANVYKGNRIFVEDLI